MIEVNDIILIILIFSVLYLLYTQDVEHFTDETEINDAIEEAINNRYLVNLSNMRDLNNFILSLSNEDKLNITQNTTKLFDLKTNSLNANGSFTVFGKSLINSDVTVQGLVLPAVNNLTFKNTNVENTIKINSGKFNDILPKGSILLFSIKDNNYNIPYGWVPCDGSYYDLIQATANQFGKLGDAYGTYARFYSKSKIQPELRNLDLAYEQITYTPNIQQLIKLKELGLDNYEKQTGVINEPFNEYDLEALRIWETKSNADKANKVASYSTKNGLSSEPIKREYIYIRKII